MKNVLLSVALFVATFISANAQFYAGGSIGFENNSVMEPKLSLSVNPIVGFYISKKFDVGLDVGFATTRLQSDVKSSIWSIEPYARYSFFQLGKFEVLVKGSFSFINVDGFINVDNPIGKSTNIRMDIRPILTYNLTEKIVLFTQLNCLSLAVAMINPENDDSHYHFRFGASNSLVNTSNLPIGFFYKF